MEEVDRIIIHSLRQVGCEIDDGVKSLNQFTTEMVVEAAVRCMQSIVPGIEISPHLPPGMTARFRVGSSLAQACHDLEYPGEVGYQTFLYWDVGDIRRVLMFLIEKLPREIEKTSDEPISALALLNSKIASEVKWRLRASWLPRCFHFKDVRWTEDFSKPKPFRSRFLVYPNKLGTTSKERKHYISNYVNVVSDQVISCQELSCSVMEANAVSICAARRWETEWNQKGLTLGLSEQEFFAKKKKQVQHRMQVCIQQEINKGTIITSKHDDVFDMLHLTNDTEGKETPALGVNNSRYALSEKLIFEKSKPVVTSDHVEGSVSAPLESEEELKQRIIDEETLLQSQVNNIAQSLENEQLEEKKLEGIFQQLQESILLKRLRNEEMLDVYKIKKKTFDLLPDGDANIEKLQNLIDSNVQRLVSLSSQWEKHRAPLVDQYRTLRELNASRVSETQHKLEEIRNLREKMKELAEETRIKGDMHNQLIADYEKITKDFNRSAYTRRILEIVANIKKQKQDIDKVLIDTKEVQKEINQLSGKLDRTFTVTDEVVFRDAKKDESVRKAYKYLAALHDNCSILVKTVEETGAIMREIRDLEDLIESENQKKVLSNLERIMADYKQMKEENAMLVSELKDRQSDK